MALLPLALSAPIRTASRGLGLGLAVLVVAACDRPDAPRPAPSEPWPASSRSADPARGADRFRFLEQSHAVVDLSSGRSRVRVRLEAPTGEFALDVVELARSSARAKFDLSRLTLLESATPGYDFDAGRALAWLGLGSEVGLVERERHRVAEFRSLVLSELSAPSAHAARARRDRPKPRDPDASENADVRTVELTAEGELSLHGYRTEHAVRLRLLLHYPVSATPGARPTRVVVTTLRPLVVSLAAHHVEPRNAAGEALPTERAVLGSELSRDARVSLELHAVPVD